MEYTLPTLSYPYDALGPHIDARTMEVHHAKHHAGYVAKLNGALKNYPELQEKSLEEILKNLESVPEAIRTVVKNSGGGHYNHSLFWKWMSPKGGGVPNGRLSEEINKAFGDFGNFKTQFSSAAINQFGSGWAWLVLTNDKKLKILATVNQDSPISQELKPILGIDIWEHAYYLKYQNRRSEYVEAWWNVVNWDEVAFLL